MADCTLENLISFCKQNNRICPQPQYWNELWIKLKNKKQISNGPIPSPPLILAAWWETPPIFKQIRFLEHIKWAAQNDQLEETYSFLQKLGDEDWFYL
jgi:hypothetical protein